jgi:hypothetical protein
MEETMKKTTLALSLLLTACSDPQTINEISSDIVNVSEDTQTLKIEMKGHGVDESSFLFSSSESAKDVLADVMKYFPDQKAERVYFTFLGEMSDKYGNKTYDPLIGLMFDMADVKKINFANGTFTGWNLLNLRKDIHYKHIAGRSIVKSYCQDEQNLKYAAEFCGTSTGNALTSTTTGNP